MHKRTKATAIPKRVKENVWERDHYRCIFCGQLGAPNAHVINRSQGGLGIEENIVTACPRCHEMMDNGKHSKLYRDAAKAYLTRVYGDWSEAAMRYRKGES